MKTGGFTFSRVMKYVVLGLLIAFVVLLMMPAGAAVHLRKWKTQ